MRYAILSDIHANFQAWEAVAADISDSGITFTASLGDVVGYGPRPADTLKAVHDSVDSFVIGNHDAAVAGVFDDSIFTEDARSIVQWSRKEIQGSSEWFLCQPHVLTIDCGAYSAICTHGSMHEPDDFNYVLSKEDALDCWNSCDEQVVFVGHTHEPCVHELSENGIYRKHQPFDFIPIPGKRYIVNVGSVGMPRGAEAVTHASYCVVDTVSGHIGYRAVDYDFEGFRQDVRDYIGSSEQSEHLLAAYDIANEDREEEEIDFKATQLIPMFIPDTERKRKLQVRRDTVRAAPTSAKRKRTPASTPAPTGQTPKRKSKAPLICVIVAIASVLLLGIISAIISATTKKRPVGPVRTSTIFIPGPVTPASASQQATRQNTKGLEDEYRKAEAFWRDNPGRNMAASVRFHKLLEKAKGTKWEAQILEKLTEIDRPSKKR